MNANLRLTSQRPVGCGAEMEDNSLNSQTVFDES